LGDCDFACHKDAVGDHSGGDPITAVRLPAKHQAESEAQADTENAQRHGNKLFTKPD